MAKEIEMLEKTWRELISFTLATQRNYVDYTVEQLNWLSRSLYTIFIEEPIAPEAIYRCLVFLNRNNKYGRYSLIFNKQVIEATNKLDLEELKSICEKSEFPELKLIPLEDRDKWNEEINIEVLSINLHTDRQVMSPHSICNVGESLISCFEETCSYKSNYNIKYFPPYLGHTIFLSEMKEGKMVKYPMREIDMIFLLLSRGNNPYTSKPLAPNVVELLINKYSDILLICKKAYSLGYRHEYKF
jgi:hypothetical protein